MHEPSTWIAALMTNQTFPFLHLHRLPKKFMGKKTATHHIFLISWVVRKTSGVWQKKSRLSLEAREKNK
jgi:hypothetical protein